MASNYPTSIDSFNDPLANSPLNNPSHAGQHQDINDAVEKLETKVGITASPAASATAGHVLTATGTGSTWQVPAVTAAQFATTGLRLIETKDVTAAATIDFTSVFSTDYRGYLLEWNYTQNTSTGDLYLQFRDSGGVISSNTYTWGWGGSFTSSGTAQFAGFSYQTTATSQTFLGSGATATNKTSGRLELWNPQDGGIVYGAGQGVSLNYGATLTHVNISGGITHNATATRTGLRLLTNAGTMTGKFSLYGFRN